MVHTFITACHVYYVYIKVNDGHKITSPFVNWIKLDFFQGTSLPETTHVVL